MIQIFVKSYFNIVKLVKWKIVVSNIYQRDIRWLETKIGKQLPQQSTHLEWKGNNKATKCKKEQSIIFNILSRYFIVPK